MTQSNQKDKPTQAITTETQGSKSNYETETRWFTTKQKKTNNVTPAGRRKYMKACTMLADRWQECGGLGTGMWA
jgi:hypothetical protein